MDILVHNNQYKTIRVRWEKNICYLQIYRPDADNSINDILVQECSEVLKECEQSANILVLEGLPEIFCIGADFKNIQAQLESGQVPEQNPEHLYNLWLQLKNGKFISIAHVRGKTNAGGVGFASACDIVLCNDGASFSLSEMLFGLMPACVLPFLIRRVGTSRAHYMTLMTQTFSVQTAHEWGLVDAYDANSDNLLRKHLLRLRLLPKKGIVRYKQYISHLSDFINTAKPKAVEANCMVFSDKNNLAKIERYVETGVFPWENVQ